MTLKQQTLILAFILGFCGAMIFGQIEQAYPHDWYTGERNPVTGEGCCGGRDCFQLSHEDFVETADEYIVTLVERRGIAPPGIYHIAKAKAQPTPHGHEGDTGYHACIWGGKMRCFFFPSGF